ncbi:hypothetical protein F4780DRAFT_23165 [Xylariomycetidae sp. FL0641]|nr:hypothetical protein F4780DRAFT_23165 [Xylariomycetidae sp. FL0641]
MVVAAGERRTRGRDKSQGDGGAGQIGGQIWLGVRTTGGNDKNCCSWQVGGLWGRRVEILIRDGPGWGGRTVHAVGGEESGCRVTTGHGWCGHVGGDGTGSNGSRREDNEEGEGMEKEQTSKRASRGRGTCWMMALFFRTLRAGVRVSCGLWIYGTVGIHRATRWRDDVLCQFGARSKREGKRVRRGKTQQKGASPVIQRSRLTEWRDGEMELAALVL